MHACCHCRAGSFASALFGTISGLAFAPDLSALYVSDYTSHSVRMLVFATGTVITIAGVSCRPG